MADKPAPLQLDLGVTSVHTGGVVSQAGPVTRTPLGQVMDKLDAELSASMGDRPKPTPIERRKARMEKRLSEKTARAAEKKARAEKKAGAKKDGRSRVPQSIHIRADIAPGGAIHVRHNLKSGAFAGDGMPVLLTNLEGTDDAPQPVWIQLAKPGTFRGHPSGKPFTLNALVFRQMIANFRANKDGRLPIDFEHAGEQEPTEGSLPQGGAPAQGWIVDLSLRDDGNLYAKVEWGALARSYIREGKYRFISPAIHLRMKDRESGQEVGAYLSSAGLTNQPFLDGMQPLAARRDGGGRAAGADVQLGGKFLEATLRSPDDYMPTVRACLGLTELATHADCSEQLARLSERCSMADATGMHEGVDLRGKYLNGLAECAGVAGNATMQDILDAVEEMIDAAIERHVEQYHEGGGANLSARQPADTTTTTATPTEEDIMSDAKLTADLATATTKIGTLEGEVTTMKATLGSKDTELTTLRATAEKLTAVGDEIVTLCKASGFVQKDGETLKDLVGQVLAANTVLLKAKTDRDEADIVSDVERAMEHYGPNGLKQVKDEQKADLLTLRRESPKSFQNLYKPLTSDEIRLLRRVAPQAPPRRLPTEPIKPGDPVLLSHNALTARLMSTEKIGYSEASDKAALIIREADEKARAAAAAEAQ